MVRIIFSILKLLVVVITMVINISNNKTIVTRYYHANYCMNMAVYDFVDLIRSRGGPRSCEIVVFFLQAANCLLFVRSDLNFF